MGCLNHLSQIEETSCSGPELPRKRDAAGPCQEPAVSLHIHYDRVQVGPCCEIQKPIELGRPAQDGEIDVEASRHQWLELEVEPLLERGSLCPAISRGQHDDTISFRQPFHQVAPRGIRLNHLAPGVDSGTCYRIPSRRFDNRAPGTAVRTKGDGPGGLPSKRGTKWPVPGRLHRHRIPDADPPHQEVSVAVHRQGRVLPGHSGPRHGGPSEAIADHDDRFPGKQGNNHGRASAVRQLRFLVAGPFDQDGLAHRRPGKLVDARLHLSRGLVPRQDARSGHRRPGHAVSHPDRDLTTQEPHFERPLLRERNVGGKVSLGLDGDAAPLREPPEDELPFRTDLRETLSVLDGGLRHRCSGVHIDQAQLQPGGMEHDVEREGLVPDAFDGQFPLGGPVPVGRSADQM